MTKRPTAMDAAPAGEKPPPTWPEACRILAAWLQAGPFQGTAVARVKLVLTNGSKIDLPFEGDPAPRTAGKTTAGSDNAAPDHGDDYTPFVPKPFQQRILAALDGKAMHKLALAAEVGDRLYKPNGIRELMEHQMVRKDERHGYYRPDRPPPELRDAIAREDAEEDDC